MPSQNSHASARGLAKLGAVMANRGQLANFRLMSKTTWDEMHGGLSKMHDVSHNIPGLTPSIISRGGLAYN